MPEKTKPHEKYVSHTRWSEFQGTKNILYSSSTLNNRLLCSWAKPNLVKKLEIVQNAALRIITGSPPWTKILNMLKETNLLSIKDRLAQLNGNIIIKTVANHTSRLQQQILTNPSSTFLINAMTPTSGIDLTSLNSQKDDFQIPPWEDTKANFVMGNIIGGKANYGKVQKCSTLSWKGATGKPWGTLDFAPCQVRCCSCFPARPHQGTPRELT